MVKPKLRRARLAIGLLTVATCIGGKAAQAQDRSADNAVTQAEDAFGFSVGRESIGIYSAGQTRGFSPVGAGNVRIDGLYFDPIAGLQRALLQSTSIKVGLSAQGYPFTAPSGIFDQKLRRPQDQFGASLIARTDDWGAYSVEVNGSVPVTDTLGAAVSVTVGSDVYANFTDNFNHSETLILRWRPTDRIEIVPFWSMYDNYDDEAGTYYLPKGDYLPKVDRPGHDESPHWSDNRFTAKNVGAVSSVQLGKNTVARLGMFRSTFDFKHGFTFLIADIDEEGFGERLLFASPHIVNRSNSGEARLTHSLADGPRLHVFHLSVRHRNSHRAFGGNDMISYGIGPVGERVTDPEPDAFEFGPQTELHTTQTTYGIAYDGRWKDVAELSFGISRARYRKETDIPEEEVVNAKARPWIYNGTLAVILSKSVSAYAGYSRGFEESGTAPRSAANRNEPLSSIITEQKDAGVSARLGPNIRAVAGLFDLSRPYFGYDDENIFRQIGTVRAKGAEFSLSGKLSDNMSLLVGGVFFRPKVTKSADAVGEIGSKPVGIPTHIVNVNGNWAVPFAQGLQIDFGVEHRGRVPATVNNAVYLPSQFTANLGMRYGFDLGPHDASFRISVSDLFDDNSFTIAGPATYSPRNHRLVSAQLTVDY